MNGEASKGFVAYSVVLISHCSLLGPCLHSTLCYYLCYHCYLLHCQNANNLLYYAWGSIFCDCDPTFVVHKYTSTQVHTHPEDFLCPEEKNAAETNLLKTWKILLSSSAPHPRLTSTLASFTGFVFGWSLVSEKHANFVAFYLFLTSREGGLFQIIAILHFGGWGVLRI